MVTKDALDRWLGAQHGWRRVGDALIRELTLRDFAEALSLLERIAAAAVDYRRRPDMCISEYNHIRITLVNPHHAGFTEAELRLATKVNSLIEVHHSSGHLPA